jgi:hypothetical protein
MGTRDKGAEEKKEKENHVQMTEKMGYKEGKKTVSAVD